MCLRVVMATTRMSVLPIGHELLNVIGTLNTKLRVDHQQSVGTTLVPLVLRDSLGLLYEK